MGLVNLKRRALEENRTPRWLNTTAASGSAFFPPSIALQLKAGSRPVIHAKKEKRNTHATAWVLLFFGADYGARTRHLDLGKVALYQMS